MERGLGKIEPKFVNPKVGIVGGTGRMGSWLASLLEEQELTVLRASRRTALTPLKLARQCDVVVISVPIADTVNVIREIGPIVSEKALLMDLTSVKKEPVEAMLRCSRSQVVGLHPLFGPEAKPGLNLKVAVCPGRGESGLEWVKGIFRALSFKVVLLEPEVHDRLMGLIQGVNHFSTLALALSIEKSVLGMENLLEVSTRIFRERLSLIKAVVDQPAELLGSVMMENPSAASLIGEYVQSAVWLSEIIRQGDKEAFAGVMESLKVIFDTLKFET